ncbi:MAG: histidine--tRNA ligase [Bacteriovoracaceae bacterium]|nr:histidine--tRNA ligase [Bacteriovoracaceae bacterium]
MSLSKRPYKGTRDFFPVQERLRKYIFSHMSKTAELFGYEPYDGPLLEEVELYKAKSGEELINEQIYSFTDRGDRFVAIRPEMTPTLARMIAQIHRETPKPIRFYSIPNLMRYEKPQKGRLREHWQFNVDIFGAPKRQGEFEILQIAVALMEELGATNKMFEILINDRTIVETIFKKIMGLDDKKVHKLYKIVDKSKKVSPKDLKEMIDATGISEEAKEKLHKYLAFSSFEDVLSFFEDEGQADCVKDLYDFLNLVNNSNLKNFLHYDPTIVRGLDYYTGIVFEIFDKHPENRRAICGGGSYADLLTIFNEPSVPGVGFGLGDVTLTDFLKTHQLLPDFTKPCNDLLLTFQDENAVSVCMNLATELRRKNMRVITHLESLKLKKIFPLAEKKGAGFVGMIGSKELSTNRVQIKNMKTKKQYDICIDEIDEIVKVIHEI